MKEYFIVANSFAAPFVSDSSEKYVKAETPEKALIKFAKSYKHPCGLYAAICYENAEAYHKNRKPLATWLCNHEAAKMKLTERLGGYSYLGHEPGYFEINDQPWSVDDPKGGMVYAG